MHDQEEEKEEEDEVFKEAPQKSARSSDSAGGGGGNERGKEKKGENERKWCGEKDKRSKRNSCVPPTLSLFSFPFEHTHTLISANSFFCISAPLMKTTATKNDCQYMTGQDWQEKKKEKEAEEKVWRQLLKRAKKKQNEWKRNKSVKKREQTDEHWAKNAKNQRLFSFHSPTQHQCTTVSHCRLRFN